MLQSRIIRELTRKFGVMHVTAACVTASAIGVASVHAAQDETCEYRWDDPIGHPGTYHAELTEFNDRVQVLEVLEDLDNEGTMALYVGGDFQYLGGVEANGLAKWDSTLHTVQPYGQSLDLLGHDSFVAAITMFDSGTGPELYVGGTLSVSGVSGTEGIARARPHNGGVEWSSVGGGVAGSVAAIEIFDDGSGPALYVGGSFWSAGGIAANNIAKWDPATHEWSVLGDGFGGAGAHAVVVRAMVVFDDGSGSALYAGGYFGSGTANLAKWDPGSETWLPLEGEFNGIAHALHVYDDGQGDALYVGGYFSSVENPGGEVVPAKNIARWDGKEWSPLGSGLEDGDFQNLVTSMAAFNDGDGEVLYVGGSFNVAGGQQVKTLARWDGIDWSAPPGGTPTPYIFHRVHALAVHDDNGKHEPRLYAGGEFLTIGGAIASNVAGRTCRPICNASEHVCTTENDGASCASIGCARQIAAIDPTCCLESWHAGCALLAADLCASYQHDDGTTDLVKYLNSGANGTHVGMLNEFTVLPGAEAINAVEVRCWPDYATGWFPTLEDLPMTLHIWRDTVGDGHPSDAVLVASQDVTMGPSSNSSVLFQFEPVYVGPPGSRFFVGLVYEHSHASGKYYTLDLSVPIGRSWLLTSNELDPANLSSVTHVDLLDDEYPPFWNGNWPIRAYGVPFTAPLGDLTGDGSVGVADLLVLLGAWGACDDGPDSMCPADLDGDGGVGVSDLLILLTNWN